MATKLRHLALVKLPPKGRLRVTIVKSTQTVHLILLCYSDEAIRCVVSADLKGVARNRPLLPPTTEALLPPDRVMRQLEIRKKAFEVEPGPRKHFSQLALKAQSYWMFGKHGEKYCIIAFLKVIGWSSPHFQKCSVETSKSYTVESKCRIHIQFEPLNWFNLIFKTQN